MKGKHSFDFPRALSAEMGKINPNMSDGRVLPSLLTKDTGGYRVNDKTAKKLGRKNRWKRPIGFSFTLAEGVHGRLMKASKEMGMQLADVVRVAVHTALPNIEKAAVASIAERQKEKECPRCSGRGKIQPGFRASEEVGE